VKFEVGDKVRISKVETSPGQFLGQAGMIGVVTSVGAVPFSIDGGPLEHHYTMDLSWPHSPERVESISFLQSQIELRFD
jgi:hypothetical protein